MSKKTSGLVSRGVRTTLAGIKCSVVIEVLCDGDTLPPSVGLMFDKAVLALKAEADAGPV